jgi:type II restriction enzyme
MLNKKEQSRVAKIESDRLSFILNDLNQITLEYGLSKSLDRLNSLVYNKTNSKIYFDIFPTLIEYIFLKMKNEGEIEESIFVTTNPIANKFTKSCNTLFIDNSPEYSGANLAFYSMKDKKLKKCFLFLAKKDFQISIKKIKNWKIFAEIATSDCSVREKYNIRYDNETMPLVGFATVNFYDEINNPQHRGMFQFFDSSFIGKPIKSDFISNLSELPEFVRANLL